MNAATQLSNAILIATQRHDGQTDKSGKPYILHPLKVMHYLKTDDYELMAIAVLHDVLEDTFNTLDEGVHYLHNKGFTDRVIMGVVALTKVAGESFDVYKARVMSNSDARAVKKCDLRHNSDIRRLKGVTDKDIQRTVKYQRFYMEILQYEENLANE